MLDTQDFPVKDLHLFYKNPRVGNVSEIATSLRVNGQYRAIVVNRGTHTGRPMEVLAGNHTLKAARELGWETILAHLGDWDEDQCSRIVLADNRTAELGDIDDEILAGLLQDLDDLEGTGYDAEFLAQLEDEKDVELLTEDDEIPEAVQPRSQTGDVWVLGGHRVVCGDSTDPSVVEILMDGELADVMWTDPPYGVEYVGKTKDALTIENDGAAGLRQLLDGIFSNAFDHLRGGAPFYVAHADSERITFETALEAAGFTVRQNLIWAKNTITFGRGDYHYSHEPILYGFKPAGKGYGRMGRGGEHWFGDNAQATVRYAAEALVAANDGNPDSALIVDLDELGAAFEAIRTQITILEYPKPAASTQHPTMKPVALIEGNLRNSAHRGDIVLDLCGGSGSTLLAAEKLRLNARLVELDPKFVDVIVSRWEAATGEQAVLVREGQVAA